MGFADAMVGIANAVNAMNGRGRIERLCRELGWSIDGRDGNQLTLNFNCPVIGERPVFIREGDKSLVFITAYSFASFDSRRVPDEVMGLALLRSSESPAGKWEMRLYDGKAFFVVAYNALGAALDAATFKYICSSMVTIASNFDENMKAMGYLQ